MRVAHSPLLQGAKDLSRDLTHTAVPSLAGIVYSRPYTPYMCDLHSCSWLRSLTPLALDDGYTGWKS